MAALETEIDLLRFWLPAFSHQGIINSSLIVDVDVAVFRLISWIVLWADACTPCDKTAVEAPTIPSPRFCQTWPTYDLWARIICVDKSCYGHTRAR